MLQNANPLIGNMNTLQQKEEEEEEFRKEKHNKKLSTAI